MTQQQNDEFSNVNNMNRRQLLKHVSIASSSIASIASIQVSKAFADVSDGNSLPQGAQQFASIIRLKSDLIVSLS